MRYKLIIETNNDAFADGNDATETARILRAISDRIDRDGLPEQGNTIYGRDYNGNNCASFVRMAR